MIHVGVAIFWIGGGLLFTVLAMRAERVRDPEEITRIARQAAFAGEKLFAPAGLVVLAMGITMVINDHIGFGTTWVIIGLVGYALTFTTGIAVLAPLSKKSGVSFRQRRPDCARDASSDRGAPARRRRRHRSPPARRRRHARQAVQLVSSTTPSPASGADACMGQCSGMTPDGRDRAGTPPGGRPRPPVRRNRPRSRAARRARDPGRRRPRDRLPSGTTEAWEHLGHALRRTGPHERPTRGSTARMVGARLNAPAATCIVNKQPPGAAF
jgi:uncharacterized membrane protein